MKILKINSPAGSGNTFATQLIQKTLDCNLIHTDHNPEELDTEDNQIHILRNPYDCIASALERHLGLSEDKFLVADHISIDDTDKLKEYLDVYCAKYYWFMEKMFKSKNILNFTFEFLTENPLKFIDVVSNTFSIDKKEFETNEISKTIFEELAKSKLANRTPREKSQERIQIDEFVKKSIDVELLYENYYMNRNILQSTENMIQ
jgi:hypothetical protein